MGCCLSKSSTTSSPKSVSRGRRDDPPQNSRTCRVGAPPLPVAEEETVKEVVLSETAKPTSPAVEKANAGVVEWPPENREFKLDEEIKPKEAVVLVKPAAEDIASEVSEQSELCSFTESFSTTTTTTATALDHKKDDGEEVTQRSPMKYRRKRPNATGDMVGFKERNVRSPGKRGLPSPEKRRPVMSSKPVQGRATMNAQRRNTGPPNGLRRESGEGGSARRSRSPVTRRNIRYKNPSLGETGKPGGRSPARAVGENGGNKVERQNDTVLRESKDKERQNDDESRGNGESLENPLVSLECFIFL